MCNVISAVFSVPWHCGDGYYAMIYRQWFLCQGIAVMVTVQCHIGSVLCAIVTSAVVSVQWYNDKNI